MEDEVVDRPPLGWRIRRLLDRAEGVYLTLLRGAILVIATLLIAWCVILATISLYRVLQSPNSVHEKPAAVAANELAAQEGKTSPTTSPGEGSNPAQRNAYARFLNSYYTLFRAKFEPYRQPDDKQLSRGEFDDNFVGSQNRLQAISEGKVKFGSDIADLNSLLAVMREAADLPETRQKLAGYKSAKKVQVCRSVEHTRTEYVKGWDRYATTCPNWYDEPIGCAVTRPTEVPYTARECSMQFPEGTRSHSQLFRGYQDRYFQLLGERRTQNASEAEAARLGIIEGIAKGKMGLRTAITIAAAFLILMFFFLLIAIERHQRRSGVEKEA